MSTWQLIFTWRIWLLHRDGRIKKIETPCSVYFEPTMIRYEFEQQSKKNRGYLLMLQYYKTNKNMKRSFMIIVVSIYCYWKCYLLLTLFSDRYLKGGKLHFNASIGALVSKSGALQIIHCNTLLHLTNV